MPIRLHGNLLATVFLCALAGGVSAVQPEQTSADGLQLTPSKNVEMLYTRAGASLAGYRQVAILDCYVAFRKNWQRDQNDSAIRVTSADMDRIKKNLRQSSGPYSSRNSPRPDMR